MKYILCLCIFLGCISRGNLDLKTYPQTCALYIECMYYQSTSKADKSGCEVFADACKKTIIYDKCKRETSDPRDFQTCLDKLM